MLSHTLLPYLTMNHLLTNSKSSVHLPVFLFYFSPLIVCLCREGKPVPSYSCTNLNYVSWSACTISDWEHFAIDRRFAFVMCMSRMTGVVLYKLVCGVCNAQIHFLLFQMLSPHSLCVVQYSVLIYKWYI